MSDKWKILFETYHGLEYESELLKVKKFSYGQVKCRSVLIERQLTANKAETILVLEATPKSKWKVAVSRYLFCA